MCSFKSFSAEEDLQKVQPQMREDAGNLQAETRHVIGLSMQVIDYESLVLIGCRWSCDILDYLLGLQYLFVFVCFVCWFFWIMIKSSCLVVFQHL